MQQVEGLVERGTRGVVIKVVSRPIVVEVPEMFTIFELNRMYDRLRGHEGLITEQGQRFTFEQVPIGKSGPRELWLADCWGLPDQVRQRFLDGFPGFVLPSDEGGVLAFGQDRKQYSDYRKWPVVSLGSVVNICCKGRLEPHILWHGCKGLVGARELCLRKESDLTKRPNGYRIFLAKQA